MSRVLPFIVFLAVSLGGGLMIGSLTETAGWYENLAKPPFNPPGWVFPIAWSILYVLIAIAGWIVWQARNMPALVAWAAQMLLNFAWTPTFFTAHAILPALVIILTLLATIGAFLTATYRREMTAFWCFMPYAAWVAFASLLNGSILWLNPA